MNEQQSSEELNRAVLAAAMMDDASICNAFQWALRDEVKSLRSRLAEAEERITALLAMNTCGVREVPSLASVREEARKEAFTEASKVLAGMAVLARAREG